MFCGVDWHQGPRNTRCITSGSATGHEAMRAAAYAYPASLPSPFRPKQHVSTPSLLAHTPSLLPLLPPASDPPQEAEEAGGKQRAAQAASVEALRDAMAARAGEVSHAIERNSRRASKMPELAQMLMPFLD